MFGYQNFCLVSGRKKKTSGRSKNGAGGSDVVAVLGLKVVGKLFNDKRICDSNYDRKKLNY